jgi:hypothetical protein
LLGGISSLATDHPIKTVGSYWPYATTLYEWLDPCESLISILWKFEKANALPGHVVARLMGPDIDPYEGVLPQLRLIDIVRLHDTLAVLVKMLRAALLQPSQRRPYSNVFRHCRRCVAHGYHSVLHQIESISVCPAHRRLWKPPVSAAATKHRISSACSSRSRPTVARIAAPAMAAKDGPQTKLSR